ncbi:hypothetical protein SK128_026667 [Halocaridina rubra]|uniref:Uncharacterized protein n=1 Tax=Halocaridina rubra TaxID=373956 RepID=A0AAN8XI89_HALRR
MQSRLSGEEEGDDDDDDDIKDDILRLYIRMDQFSRVEDLLGETITHQGLDFREVSGALGGGSGPGRGGLGVGSRHCPSMPLTPDLDSEALRPSPPRSQSQPSDLTQVEATYFQ